MIEGEKNKKKIYKRGDIVTFRLLKRVPYSDSVLRFINEANAADMLNVELLAALELYAEYKSKISQTENKLSFFMDKVSDKENIVVKEVKEENNEIREELNVINEEINIIETNLDNAYEETNLVGNDPVDELFSTAYNESAADEIFSNDSAISDNKTPENSNTLARALRSIRRT